MQGKLKTVSRYQYASANGTSMTVGKYTKVASLPIRQTGLYIIKAHWQWSDGKQTFSVGRLTTYGNGELPNTVVRNNMTFGAGADVSYIGYLNEAWQTLYFELYSDVSNTISSGGLAALLISEDCI